MLQSQLQISPGSLSRYSPLLEPIKDEKRARSSVELHHTLHIEWLILAVALAAAAFLATLSAAAFVSLAAALLASALFTTTALIAFFIVWHNPPFVRSESICLSRLHSFKT
jgi:small-conductance mechanosensitive channel